MTTMIQLNKQHLNFLLQNVDRLPETDFLMKCLSKVYYSKINYIKKGVYSDNKYLDKVLSLFKESNWVTPPMSEFVYDHIHKEKDSLTENFIKCYYAVRDLTRLKDNIIRQARLSHDKIVFTDKVDDGYALQRVVKDFKFYEHLIENIEAL